MNRRLFPDSLFGRLIAAVLVVVLTTGAVIVGLLVRERHDVAYRGSEAADVVELIAETSSALAGLDPEQRSAALRGLTVDGLTIDASRRERGTRSSRDPAADLEAFRQRLGRALGRGYEIRLRPALPGGAGVIRIDRAMRRGDDDDFRRALGPRPLSGDGGPVPAGGPRRGPQVDVLVALPDGAGVVFRTGLPLGVPPLPRQIFVELAMLTAFLAAVLFVMARTITRPLSELATAAEAVGRGERRAPLRETGARELREATHAFNAMQERLHRYLDSRTRVLAAMSHDLRTPLTRLRLRVESLDDDDLRKRFSGDLDEMSGMIEGALKLFRGLNHDEPDQAVDAAALLETLRSEFAELGATVTVDAADGVNAVTKPAALKRCLTNLISNAVKYAGQAAVSARLEGGELVLRIEDDGPGIPEGQLEQVFEPFYRVEGSRSADTGGIGLGLGIARDIAQALGGTLKLANRAPHGLEAVLRIPIGEAPRRS
jgi:signal transduction histidine kinase